MNEPAGTHKASFASIDQGDRVVRLERLQAVVDEAGQEQVRISLWRQGEMLDGNFTLTEDELIRLLQAAIHDRVLSRGFWARLHSVIEI